MEAIFSRAREALSRREDSIVYGDIPEGIGPERIDSDHSDIAPLLAVSNGPRCGIFVLFSDTDLPGSQFYCDDQPGGRENWLCFGLADCDPLFLKRDDGSVWIGDLDGVQSTRLVVGGIPEFVDGILFGRGYMEYSFAGDDWPAVLEELDVGEVG